MEVKELSNYDMSRVISRARKEFGTIKKGTEELYDPGLNYLEREIYSIYKDIPITDFELREVIEMIIYDLKGKIERKRFDYSKIRDEKKQEFSRRLELLFNPFENDNLKADLRNVNLERKEDLQAMFTFPIKCLLRIYDSIEFWHKQKGINGYYRMLEEYVLPIYAVGRHPYVLEDEYISEDVNLGIENLISKDEIAL